jgi:LuxR family transcriptional activator of conjugal transfer of Ti plasmids
MQTNLTDILSGLEGLKTKDAFKRKLDQTFADMGFNRFCYLGVKGDLSREPSTKRTADDAIFLTNVPTAWTDHYLENSFQDDDPIIKESMSARLPFNWSERHKPAIRSHREEVVINDGLDFGIRRGFTVPIHGPSGEMGIMSLYSDLADKQFLKAVHSAQHDLHVLSMHFHDAVQKTLAYGESIPKPIPLTDREVEILRWTAIGKTAWEIGSILHISERTVNFHLQNLMGKLGVHNKTHAAAKAMTFGLIQA